VAVRGRGKRTRVLALDIGGVVYRSWPDQALYERWAPAFGCSAQALQAHLWGPHWAAAELGEITKETCYETAGANLGVSAALVRDLIFEAFASQPDEALASCVVRLRQRGVVVTALTNNPSPAAELLARPELVRLFDLAITSADAHLTKPDPAFYRHAEARLGAAGADIVFVDDMLENIDAALRLGWSGVHFQSTDQAIEEIESALA
jgi:epoxide hydrolase-like predicted phosphatase